MKIPSQRKKVKEILGLGEERNEPSDDTPLILKLWTKED
jgi:hypothetical protein